MVSDDNALAEFARSEQRELWSNLSNATRHVISGGWSMECDNLAHRIREAGRALSAPTDWRNVPIPLLGLYEFIEGVPLPDHEAAEASYLRYMNSQQVGEFTSMNPISPRGGISYTFGDVAYFEDDDE